MSDRGSAKAGRMVVHDGTFRVVVFKNPEPAHEHDVVHALCIEQSLGGRGTDVAAALEDLADTVMELLVEEYAQSLPEYVPNPDQALIDVYDGKSDEYEGFPVIRRGKLRIRLERVSVKGKRTGKGRVRLEEASFEPALARLPGGGLAVA